MNAIRPSSRPPRRLPLWLTALAMAGSAAMSGYESMAVTALIAGGESAVKGAMLKALHGMHIKVTATSKTDGGDLIQARAAGHRDIEVELEAQSANITRMRAVARDGLLHDGAVALEIILQTKRVMGSL